MNETVALNAGEDVMVCEVRDEAVLLHMSTERYLTLNESALRMWELLTTGSADAALETLAGEYDVDRELLSQDLDRFRRQVVELGLATES